MTSTSEKPRTSRSKRKEQFMGQMAKMVGSIAIVTMIASVFYVVMQKLWQPPRLDQEYLEAMYAPGEGRSKWSGQKNAQPALFDRNTGRKNILPPSEPSSVAGETAALELGTPAGMTPKAVPVGPGVADIESKRPQIEAVVRGFMEAASVERRLPFVRDPARVRPLMENFYRRHPVQGMAWQGLGWVKSVEEPGFRLGYVQALFVDAAPANLIVEETSAGEFKVDWESYVRYGELSWQDFMKSRPAQPTLFRVLASRVVGTMQMRTGDHIQVLEIKHPAENGVVYGYFDTRDPGLTSLLDQMNLGKWADVPLTLRLCYTGASSDEKSVKIAGIEGKGWLILQSKRS